MSKHPKNLGIIVSGGPAPGINSLVSSLVINAAAQSVKTIGFEGGFKGVLSSECSRLLSVSNVCHNFSSGGSILGTSRFNPFRNSNDTQKFCDQLDALNIGWLAIIGGDGSAYLSRETARQVKHIQVVHLPKTIDNDLPLPESNPSFGFETARSTGSTIVSTLVVDARTEGDRYFLVTTMGRRAGFLSLGVGLAAAATATFIPEEFSKNGITLSDIVTPIVTCIRNRASAGKYHGVIILAEGLIDLIDPKSDNLVNSLARDELGRVIHSQADIGRIIIPLLTDELTKIGINLKLISKNLGYELRCCPPIGYDLEYTKFLGVAAIKFLSEGKSEVLIVRDGDNFSSIPLSSITDPDGNIKTRTVDLNSDLYRVARSFMLR